RKSAMVIVLPLSHAKTDRTILIGDFAPYFYSHNGSEWHRDCEHRYTVVRRGLCCGRRLRGKLDGCSPAHRCGLCDLCVPDEKEGRRLALLVDGRYDSGVFDVCCC